MAELWPSSLQNYLNEDSFSLKLGETAITSEVDVGPKKRRRRFTRPIDTITCSIDLLGIDKYEDFYFFFNTTLNGGVKTFNFDHPITGLESEFRFTQAPDIKSLGGGNFQVVMEWEIMP